MAKVWENKVDDRYDVYVTRIAPYEGLLTVKDGEKIIKEIAVGISYDAMFGPDVADVTQWQDWCIEAIDAKPA